MYRSSELIGAIAAAPDLPGEGEQGGKQPPLASSSDGPNKWKGATIQ